MALVVARRDLGLPSRLPAAQNLMFLLVDGMQAMDVCQIDVSLFEVTFLCD